MTRWLAIATLLVACSDDPSAEGDLPIPSRFQPLADSLEAERQALGAPGVAALVLEDGEVTFARGFGSRHPGEEDPVTSTTLFRIASVTKMLTSAVLLQHVAAGQVGLDDAIPSVIPELSFQLDASWAPSITLRHLLSHTSALVDVVDLTVPPEQQQDDALASFLTGPFEQMAYLMAPSGRMYNYSNTGYYLAGLAVEKLSGTPYRQAMKTALFEPLGMDRTTFLPADVLADGDFAHGDGTNPLTGAPWVVGPDAYDVAWERPAGFAFSSVWDLSRFARFLLDGNDTVLPATERQAMQSPQVSTEELLDLVHYGYGLVISDGLFVGQQFHATRAVVHDGAIPGFSSLVFLLPAQKFGIILLSNAEGAYFPQSLQLAIETLAGLPAPSTPPDLSVDPGTFGMYAGTYRDPFNVGGVTVEARDGGLFVTMPDLEMAGVAYEPGLTPIAPHNFLLHVQGGQLPITFIRGEGGDVEFLRSRVFVAEKTMSGKPAPVAVHRARLLRDLRSARTAPRLHLPRPTE